MFQGHAVHHGVGHREPVALRHFRSGNSALVAEFEHQPHSHHVQACRQCLSSKCGFATLLDPHGGRPALAGLGALSGYLAAQDSVHLIQGDHRHQQAFSLLETPRQTTRLAACRAGTRSSPKSRQGSQDFPVLLLGNDQICRVKLVALEHAPVCTHGRFWLDDQFVATQFEVKVEDAPGSPGSKDGLLGPSQRTGSAALKPMQPLATRIANSLAQEIQADDAKQASLVPPLASWWLRAILNGSCT